MVARVPVRICWQSGRRHWFPARRSITTGEITYNICCGPRRTAWSTSSDRRGSLTMATPTVVPRKTATSSEDSDSTRYGWSTNLEICRIICSTNAIESLNARYYDRAVRARGHFPTERAALKCLHLVTRSLDPTGTGPGQVGGALEARPQRLRITPSTIN